LIQLLDSYFLIDKKACLSNSWPSSPEPQWEIALSALFPFDNGTATNIMPTAIAAVVPTTPAAYRPTSSQPCTLLQLSTPLHHLQQLPTAHTSSGPIRVSCAAQKFTNQGWHRSTWIAVPACGSLNILQQKNEILHILHHSISLFSYFIISHDAFPLLPARKAACSEAITTAAQNNPLVLNCIQHDEA
jgi:hypothetical protein